MKKVYDTIQLSRAPEVSLQLSQSSVEDNPGFDMAKAQECAPMLIPQHLKVFPVMIRGWRASGSAQAKILPLHTKCI